MIIKITQLICILFLSIGVFAQKKMAGVEFNTKGIKVLVVETKPENSSEFRLKGFWGESINATATEDRVTLLKKINAGLVAAIQKIKLEQNVDNNKIFLISDLALFSENEMIGIQKELLLHGISNVDFLSHQKSNEFLFEGLLKKEDKNEAVLININENQTAFSSYSKKNGFQVSVVPNSSFVKLGFLNDDTKKDELLKLHDNLKQLFYYNDNLKDKATVYLTGEAAWASYALFNGGTVEAEFNPVKISDLENHQISLDKKFSRYEVLASANVEADKIITYYSKNELSIGNKILTFILKNIENNTKKKILYCKNTNKAKLVNYLTSKLN